MGMSPFSDKIKLKLLTNFSGVSTPVDKLLHKLIILYEYTIKFCSF